MKGIIDLHHDIPHSDFSFRMLVGISFSLSYLKQEKRHIFQVPQVIK